MNKLLHQCLLLVFLSVSLANGPVRAQTPTAATAVDPEYDRYRQRGDERYKEGKYAEARGQYQNCLEVPGFEDDAYAKRQIEECTTGLTLQKQVNEATQQGKTQVVFDLLVQLLNFNPADATTKAQLADFYERDGNQLFNQKRYDAARGSYEKALTYASDPTRRSTIATQLRNITSVSKPPKRIGLKLFTGAVAIGAGAYAFVLRSDFETKLDALNQISKTVDPDNTNVIADPNAYQRYLTAREDAKTAQEKNGLFTACVGIAAVATVAELYLLIHKPKPRTSALYWKPAPSSYGLAIGYSF